MQSPPSTFGICPERKLLYYFGSCLRNYLSHIALCFQLFLRYMQCGVGMGRVGGDGAGGRCGEWGFMV